MERRYFREPYIHLLDHAIEISEDMVGNHFKITTSRWRHYRYDIKTLPFLAPGEIYDLAYAQVLRYTQHPHERLRGSSRGEYFKICLQDHVILHALETHRELAFVPFLSYIVVHELVHVIRFAQFLQHFTATDEEREREEEMVHSLTREILSKRKISGRDEVLRFFAHSGQLEIFHSMGESAHYTGEGSNL